MKRVLVTGSGGFAGSHYINALRDNGWETVGFDIVTGVDARDYFRSADEKFDLVIHCAAVVGGRASIDGSPLMLAPNLEIDSAYFQWAERTKPGKLVYISSSAVYPVWMQGQQPWLRLTETDVDLQNPELPDQLYGWAKLTGEMLASRYSGDVLVIRPFSGYGHDQDLAYPFPAFAQRARQRQDPFVIWGSGTQVRDWIHIDDVVGATLSLVEDGARGPVNICSGDPVTMLELAEMMCAEAGYHPRFNVLTDKPLGVTYRVGNPTRMLEYYQPVISLEEGIRRAVKR